jgi:hypothetical protein
MYIQMRTLGQKDGKNYVTYPCQNRIVLQDIGNRIVLLNFARNPNRKRNDFEMRFGDLARAHDFKYEGSAQQPWCGSGKPRESYHVPAPWC